MPGSKKANVSIVAPLSVIAGFVAEVNTVARTVTEPIAMKPGIVLIAAIVWITRMIYAMSAINVLRTAATATTDAITVVKNPTSFAQAVGKNALNVLRMKCVQIVVNTVKSAVNL